MNEIGVISEVRGDRAKIAIGSMVTDFLPIFQSNSNSHSVSFSPIRVGEQVLVMPVRGELNSGVVLRGLFQNNHKSEATDKESRVEFEDGTQILYNTGSGTLKISSPKNITINCTTATIAAKSVDITAQTSITGNLQVNGSINASGSIIDAGGNTNHHSH